MPLLIASQCRDFCRDTLSYACIINETRAENFDMELPFSTLAGLVLEKFEVSHDKDRINIVASGRKFTMFHEQDCCESVVVDDIQGNIERALSETIIDATEYSRPPSNDLPNIKEECGDESCTWTFYTIRTQSETIVIRWYGSSNGYYSESVSFFEEV